MTLLGVVLVLVGAALLVAEAHLPTAGTLGVGGTLALVAGAIVAISASGAGLAVALPVGAAGGLAAGGFVYVAARKGAEGQRRRIASGAESMLGHVGTVRSWDDPDGQVAVDGALWRARRGLADEDSGLRAGDRVVVERVDGLTLSVRKAEEWEVVR